MLLNSFVIIRSMRCDIIVLSSCPELLLLLLLIILLLSKVFIYFRLYFLWFCVLFFFFFSLAKDGVLMKADDLTTKYSQVLSSNKFPFSLISFLAFNLLFRLIV